MNKPGLMRRLASRLFSERPRINEDERVAIIQGRESVFTGTLQFLPYFDPNGVVSELRQSEYLKMLDDPVVKAALLSKVLAVASLDWQVEPALEDSPRDTEASEFIRSTIDALPLGMPGLVIDLTMPRLIHGYQVAEKMRHVVKEGKHKGKIAIRDVKSKPKQLWEFRTDQFGNVLGITGQGPNVGKYWPIADFIYTRHLPLHSNPLGWSDFDAAYRAYWCKDTVIKLRAINQERNLGPVLIGKSDEQSRPALKAAMAQLKNGTFGVVPDNVIFEVLNLSGTAEGDYKQALDDYDKQIMIGIAGAVLHILEGQTGDGVGSASVSKSTAELFQWLLAVMFQEAMNKQFIPELVNWNYLGIDCPRLTLGGISEEEIGKILTNMQLAQSLGALLSRKDFHRRTGIQRAATADDTLAAPQPPAPSMGGMPGAMPSIPFEERNPKPEPSSAVTLKFAEAPRDEVALAGRDGAQAARLLGRAKDNGTLTMYWLTRRAVQRMLDDPRKALSQRYLYDGQELQRLAQQIAATNATANLLGRSRIIERADMVGVPKQFADEHSFLAFAEPPPPTLDPLQAIDYFKQLVPSLEVAPELFGPSLMREAFTLAVSTDMKMVDQVKKVIGDRLQSGKISGGPQDIDDILNEAGVTPKNPQYSEMVFRTNMMDSYNRGAAEQLDGMGEIFPVWQYLGIRDGRQGEDHEPHFDQYFEKATPFEAVRGKRVFNCRCSFRPIDYIEWEDLQKNGAKIGKVQAFAEFASNFTGVAFGKYYISGKQVDRDTYMASRPKEDDPEPKKKVNDTKPKFNRVISDNIASKESYSVGDGVEVRRGIYTMPDGKDIEVYRWESKDSKGDWWYTNKADAEQQASDEVSKAAGNPGIAASAPKEKATPAAKSKTPATPADGSFGLSPSKTKITGSVPDKAKSIASKMLGIKDGNKAIDALGPMLGMPDDVELKIEKVDGNNIHLTASGDILFADRVYGIGKDGKAFIENMYFGLADRGTGAGQEIFARQVQAASAAGFSHIETSAVGMFDSSGKIMNGYYTWPAFGYDQSFDDPKSVGEHFDKARAVFPKAKSVLDIFETPKVKGLSDSEVSEISDKLNQLDAKLGRKGKKRTSITGAEWWKVNGGEMANARFDLTPGSRSMQTLQRRLSRKKKTLA